MLNKTTGKSSKRSSKWSSILEIGSFNNSKADVCWLNKIHILLSPCVKFELLSRTILFNHRLWKTALYSIFYPTVVPSWLSVWHRFNKKERLPENIWKMKLDKIIEKRLTKEVSLFYTEWPRPASSNWGNGS